MFECRITYNFSLTFKKIYVTEDLLWLLYILLLKSFLCSDLFQIQLRGFLSHIQQLRIGYWGLSSIKGQSSLSNGMPSPLSKDATNDDQQPAEASGIGRSWVQSMFSREASSRSHSFSRVRKWTSDGGASAMSFINFGFLQTVLFNSSPFLLSPEFSCK